MMTAKTFYREPGFSGEDPEGNNDMITVNQVLLMASECLRPHRDDEPDDVSLDEMYDKQGLSEPMCDLYDLMRTSKRSDQQLIRDVVDMLGVGNMSATAQSTGV